MASRSRGAISSVVGLFGTVVVTMSLVFAVSPAEADPAKPQTVEQAKQQVDKLNDEAAGIDQDYAAAQERLAASQKKLADEQSDLTAQQKKVDGMRTQVAQIALATFQQRDANTTVAILSSNADNLFGKLSTMQQVSANQLTVLQRYQAEQANLNDMKVAAESEVHVQTKAKQDMADARTKSDAKLAEAKQVLTQLTAEERERMAQQEAQARAADARRANAAAQTSRSGTRTNPETTESKSTKSSDPAPVAASGRGGKALAFARAQVGKAYVYAGNGPNAYDCSGLTTAAWRTAGVGLPRTSQGQFGIGRSIPESQLQPGDLVFYYGGISHVGMYAGNGMIVHAANPRTGVAYAPLHSMPYMGARRPG